MTGKRAGWLAAAVAGFLLLLLGPSHAAQEPVFATDAGAIRGYDPVAYFTEGRPVRGDRAFRFRYQGADWFFASAENRDRFAGNPKRYAPQYGGYCAWAVSQGYTASIDPEAWAVVDGKLYLNYSKGVQRKWSRDIPGNIKAADTHWPKLLAR
ncbi:MAG: YHS domain-containing (seleno)protein [Gammaproteobacteria bacterium]